jgi:hypothetical protein
MNRYADGERLFHDVTYLRARRCVCWISGSGADELCDDVLNLLVDGDILWVLLCGLSCQTHPNRPRSRGNCTGWWS